MENKQVIEINGVKLEIDMRHARRIEELHIGSAVKVLVKQYSDYKVYPGIIVGFEEFSELPTIVVAYLDVSFSSADVKFLHYNKSSKDVEICGSFTDEMELNRADALKHFDREISKKERELNDLKEKKSYFENKFGSFWEKIHAINPVTV